MLQPYVSQSLNAYRLIVAIGLAAAIVGGACASRSTSEFWRAFGWSILAIGLFEFAAGGWFLLKSDQKFAALAQLNDVDLTARALNETSGYLRSLAVQACLAAASAAVLYFFPQTILRGSVCGLLAHIPVIALIDLGGIARERALMAVLQ